MPNPSLRICYASGETVQIGDHVDDNGQDAIVNEIHHESESVPGSNKDGTMQPTTREPGISLLWDIGLPVFRPITSTKWSGIRLKNRAAQPVAEIEIRYIDPGENRYSIVSQFIETLATKGIRVSEKYPVSQNDIHDEKILPPVLTIFPDSSFFTGNPEHIESLNAAIQELLDSYRSLNLNGYHTGFGEFIKSSELGVFFQTNKSPIKYYIQEGYSPEALLRLGKTFNSEKFNYEIDNEKSSLGTLIFWKNHQWQLFKSGLETPFVPL